MRVLIVESEIYLAQSIASKLAEEGYACEITASIKEAERSDDFDVVLLSTNINGQDFYPLIDKFRDKIIILLVSYISQDTVSEPLKRGANDYILKPFMIEELKRKINHLREFERLKKINETYEKYIDYAFKDLSVENISVKEPLPLFLKTNYQKYADAYAFAFAKKLNEVFKFYPLTQKGALGQIKSEKSSQLLYITEFQNLKRSEKTQFLEIIKDKRAIISTTESEDLEFNTIEIKSENKIYDINDILTIDEYVKYIIMNYQSKFPDTMLSKKLGISRKSLWEKRKKYEIFKKR